MHNLIKDKYKILELIGSFYTNQMNSQASKQAGRITYVPFQTNIAAKINQIIQYLGGNCYSIADYLVIPIDKTVIEYGVLSENQDFRSIKYKNFYKTYINNLELQKNQRIIYKINFNKDIYITALQLEEDASLLFEGVDFTSEFGCIYTYNTPSSIFGDSIHVRKYIQKKVNSNNYRLGVQDIYGDTNFITDFYKNNQSLKAFKYALLQAAGFPIIQEDDYIKNKLRTKDGCVYVTSKGKFYTADFKHNELNINDIVNKNQYIGSEILSIILPEDPIPNDLTHITFNGGSITGNKDIIISNSTKTLFNDNIFIAENFAQDGAGKQAYLNYINQIGAAEKPSSSVPDSMNCIDFLRNVVATDRCLLIQVDEEKISYDMTMKLKSFVVDHAPIGSIIAYSNGKPIVDPDPEPPTPTIVTIDGELTKGQTQDSYRGLYHAFAFNLSESDGIITWNKQIDSDSDITINNIVLTTPNIVHSKTTSPVKLALYQADESRFIAVSDVVEWQINTTCTFTFGENANVKFTDRLMFVFVHPDTPQEQLINPVDTGLSVEDDNFTLAAWYIKVRSDGTSQSYPSKWGVITSASLDPTNRQYMPIFTMQIQQTV